MKNVRTLGRQEAEDKGYIPCAGPFRRNTLEQSWLTHVMSDMKGARIVVVDTVDGPEIWRHESEWDLILKKHRLTRNLSTHYA